jgi:hypothetical protein
MFEPTCWHRACRAIALFSLALLFTSIEFEACAQTTRDHRDAEVEFSIATLIAFKESSNEAGSA